MGNFKRDNKKSGGGFNRRFGGGGKRFGGRDGGRPAMHKVTCGKCGVSCEVPFRPTGERPVFCNNCFKSQGAGGGRPDKFGDKRHEGSSFGDKQMHNAVCDKCGKDCQVPFRPTAGKPIFCSNCFKQDGGEDGDSGEIIEQINLLSVKIDKLMEILTPNASIKKIKKSKVKKEAVIKKAAKVKGKKKKSK